MTYRINFESYASNFSLPQCIVDDDLAQLDDVCLKVILLIFRNADKNYSINLLSNLLGVNEQRVNEAIRYWIDRGLLSPQESDPVDSNVFVLSKKAPTAVPAPKTGSNSELSYLLECMENQLKRPITSVEYKSVVHILEYIKLPADVILMAIEYCISIDKVNARYIEKVCATWADNGITTHERAEQYLSFLKQSRQNEAAVRKLFGIEDRKLIDSERESINRWFNEYHFDQDMIRLAYERTIKTISKLSFPYINKILSSWSEKGYTCTADVETGEGFGRSVRSERGSSYDIDELDRYWDKVPKLD